MYIIRELEAYLIVFLAIFIRNCQISIKFTTIVVNISWLQHDARRAQGFAKRLKVLRNFATFGPAAAMQ